MGVFNNFPYANFHELNADWIIEQVRKVTDDWEEYKTSMDEWKLGVDDELAEFQAWFDNLDVQDEVRTVINELIQSGEFIEITSPQIVSATEAWLAVHITPTTPAVDDTLSISGAAADAKVTGDRITDLKEDYILEIGKDVHYEPQTLNLNKSINTTGNIVPESIATEANFCCLCVPCNEGDKFIISGNGGNNTRLWAFSESDGTPIITSAASATATELTVTAPENSAYFAYNSKTNISDVIYKVIKGIAFDEILATKADVSDITDLNNELNNKLDKNIIDIVNRFDKTNIISGKYLSIITGGLSDNESYYTSDYIDVSDLSEVECSYTLIVCFYNENKSFISGSAFNTVLSDNTVECPADTKYMRFSSTLDIINNAQIGKSVTRSNYVPYGKFVMPDFLLSTDKIIVDVNGNGDYTSLTEALYENVNTGVEIVVKQGTYDIVSEYIALFGQTAVNNMADSDSATFNGFQYGIIIRNRTITFEAGSNVVCDWTGHTVDGTHRFSAVRVDYNAKIIGLHLIATNTFYAIHDDYGTATAYTVEYENCYVEGINLYNANCIGGGCRNKSTHIIKNCYFNNNLTSPAVRYHNTNGAGAEPEIYVSNTYVNSIMSFNYYGAQTTKMKVFVNNCKATTIRKAQESASFTTDNVELYKWCCEES